MAATAKFRCMCGCVHSVGRDLAMDAIGVAHWQCTDCRRRFVLTFMPPQSFAPVYIDADVRSHDLRKTGSAVNPSDTQNPVPPQAIEFACRCGEKGMAHSWMYGGTLVCGGCKSSLLLVLKYNVTQKMHVIVPEYPNRSAP